MPRRSRKRPFDKYELYSASVQSPREDARYLRALYQRIRGKKRKPRILREDFCAAFALCCEWVKLDRENRAIGIDLDPEPLRYGIENYVPDLTADAISRLRILRKNVLSSSLPTADIIAALNFSYFVLRTRTELLKYFRGCRRTLRPGGLLILDVMGGTECTIRNEESDRIAGAGLRYYWDQVSYDPVTHFAKFYIHFKRDGEPKRRRVFQYDWRLWGIPELREALADAGFRRTHVLWEGTAPDGTGSGVFRRTESGEPCAGWVAYIVAER